MTVSRVVTVALGLWLASRLTSGVRLEPALDPLNAVGTLLVVGLALVIIDALAVPVRRAVLLAAGPLPVAVVAAVALNALQFWATGAAAQAAGLGFAVADFPAALAGSLLVILVSWLAGPVLARSG